MKAYFSGFMNTIIFMENRFFRRKLTEHERWHEISWKKNLISSTIQRLRCLQIWPSKGTVRNYNTINQKRGKSTVWSSKTIFHNFQFAAFWFVLRVCCLSSSPWCALRFANVRSVRLVLISCPSNGKTGM